MHNIDIKDIYQVRWCPKCGTLYDTCSNQRDYFETPQNLVKPVDRITADRDRWKKLCLELFASHKELLIEGMNLYEYYPNSHRKTVEKYFAEELELQNKIEEAISKQMEAGDA
jgi:hypothetical protein